MFELVNLDKLEPIFQSQYDSDKINKVFDKTKIKFLISEEIKTFQEK
jgi:hypothetical protein